MTRIALAYSGSPHTSHAIGWLADVHAAEVVTLTLDLGQGRRLEAVRDCALAMGASRAHVLDAHEEFAREYFLRALRADALVVGGRSLVGALSRPLLAQKLIEIAQIEHTTTVAHACAADDAPIAAAVRALRPQFTVVAVPRAGRPDDIARTRSAAECPMEPAFVELTFERGSPVAINAIPMPLLDLIGSLDIIAAAHGVGRLQGLETPAAAVLSAAHRAIETEGANEHLSRRYAELIECGDWFTSERETLDASIAHAQDRVAGIVRLKLFKGACEIVERRKLEVVSSSSSSPVSLPTSDLWPLTSDLWLSK